MQRNTLLALVVAALLLSVGTVAASDAPSRTAAAATFVMKIGHPEQAAAPNATATYRLVLDGRAETAVKLELRAPEGLRAELSTDSVAIQPGNGSSVAVKAAAGAPGVYRFVVVGTSADGETREAKGVLVVKERPPMAKHAAPPADRASDERRGEPIDRRAEPIERRLDDLLARIERALAAFEGRAAGARPMPANPEPRAIAQVALRLSDENVTLGPEGRRVALLIENGPREGRVPLQLRADGADGWKVEVEKDGLHLRPHERTFVWIAFHPDGAGSIAYAVSAGDATVRGAANFAGPSIA